MAQRLLLATRNEHKLVELRRILAPLIDVEVVGLDDVAAFDEVPESGATFLDNALIKSREAARRTGLPAMADDSGLAVDALNGMPGVLSARWSGPSAVGHDGAKLPGADQANVALLLAQLADVPDERLTARFRCAVTLTLPDGTEAHAEGEMPGRLVRAPRGTNGFGYDPIFVPDGATVPSAGLTSTGLTSTDLTSADLTAAQLTSAELSSADKDAISHRGRALRAIAPAVVRLLGRPDA